MKKLILIIFILVFSGSLFANYPFIDPIDYTLPECDIKDNKVISKNKCIGEIKENLVTFFGEIENKRPQGNGYLYSKQFEYWGTFDEGKLQGYGTMSIPAKNYTYYGDFENNQRTGFATDLDSSNGKYIGDYNKEQREGSGKYLEIKSGKIYNEKWKENKRVDRELTDSTFREYDSGIGLRFNHAGHLSLLSKNMLDEQIKKLPDWQQGVYQRPHIERVAFWGSNALNLINHDKKDENSFDRVGVEYDFFDEEEVELLFSNEEIYQDVYDEKYRFLLVNFSNYYENTLAYNVIIEVNDRYYTISYMSPYNNEFEKNKSEDDFYFFANSWEFDVPKNEVSSNIKQNNIDKKKVNLFGIPVGVKIFNDLNPTNKSYEEWVLEDYIDIYDSKAFEIKPLINNVNFDYYYARTTPVTDIIYFINAVDKNLLDKSECTLKQLTLRNALLDKYEKSNFDIKTHTVDLTEEIHLILNNEEKYSFYVNCFYRKINTDIGHQLGIKLMDHDYRNLLQSEYNDFLEIKAQNKEDKKRNIKSESVDTSGIL